MNLSVKEGYLKDANIELLDKNYTMGNIEDENQVVQEITDDKLMLRQINSNVEVALKIDINVELEETTKLVDLDKESKVILNGIYVNNKGEEITIKKEVSLNVKLIQKMDAELTQSINSYFTFKKDEVEKVLVRTNINIKLKEQEINSIPIQKTRNTNRSTKIKWNCSRRCNSNTKKY